jgi:transcriptional regulator with GAF, ATPase, and Fis domain
VTLEESLFGLANLYATVGGRVISHRRTSDAFDSLTKTAVQMVDGAEHSGITRGRAGAFETVAPTDDLVLRVDSIQYELSSGPCVDAVKNNDVFRTADLRADARWPEFGWRAFERTGVLSMLSVAVFLEDEDVVVGLNMYSTMADAFDEHAETVGTLLATHGALAVASAAAHERAENLEKALQSSREIGMAMGVLMANHKFSREQAFDLLRIASQHSHRKLSEIATVVADTGTLSVPEIDGTRRPHRPTK